MDTELDVLLSYRTPSSEPLFMRLEYKKEKEKRKKLPFSAGERMMKQIFVSYDGIHIPNQ